LARLLVAPRPIWLLDEPTTALDTVSRARLLDHVNRHLGQGGIAVAATHGALDLPNARYIALGR
jgi:heme exporter protein A